MQQNCLNIVMHSDTLFFSCVPDWWTWTTAARKCHLYFPLETKPNQSQSVNPESSFSCADSWFVTGAGHSWSILMLFI